MTRTYLLLSRWTHLDELLAPYNDGIFAKVASRNGVTLMRIAALVGMLMLVTTLALGGLVSSWMMKQIILDRYGKEAGAVVTMVATDVTTSRGSQTHWKTVEYEFQSDGGARVFGSVRNLASKLEHLTLRSRFVVAYAEAWPEINAPRSVRNDMAWLSLGLLGTILFGFHMICFLRRYCAWSGRPAATKP